MKILLTFLPMVIVGLLVPSSAAAEGDTVKLELLTLSFNGTVRELYYRNGKDVVEMTASQQGIGAPFFYKGPRLLALYDSPEDLKPRKDGKIKTKPVVRVMLPRNDDRALLVFSFKKRNQGKPGAKAYGIDTEGMKNGNYRIFNFSGKPIAAMLGDKKKIALKPQQNALVTSTKWRKKITDLDVRFATPINGRLEQVYTSVWGHRPERRMFIFVFDRPDKNRPLDIRMFFDLPAVKSAGLTAELEKAKNR